MFHVCSLIFRFLLIGVEKEVVHQPSQTYTDITLHSVIVHSRCGTRGCILAATVSSFVNNREN